MCATGRCTPSRLRRLHRQLRPALRQLTELLGPEELRQYQVYLVNERRVSRSYLIQTVCVLRFLYCVMLKHRRVLSYCPANFLNLFANSSACFTESLSDFAARTLRKTLIFNPSIF